MTTSENEKIVYAAFETEMDVRPDDIDMFNHVHSSRYMDYVLAARYDQMARCYKMPWEVFIERGLGWYLVSTQMNFKRALKIGERFVVKTQIADIKKAGVKIHFEISRLPNRKVCCDGWADYTMIDLKNGRACEIPEDVIRQYGIS